MNKKKVTKGLECCRVSMNDKDPFGRCTSECPYNSIGICVEDCRSVLSSEALELIEELDSTRLEIAHELMSNSVLVYQGKELVRCKDCAFREYDNCPFNEFSEFYKPADDFFCAAGERKCTVE